MSSIWHQRPPLALLNQRGENTIASHLGIIFVGITDNSLRATMPVDKRTHQPLGIMNGGASCVLAESVGSTGANFCVNLETHYCVGLDINTNHIRSIKEGEVTACGTPLHLGRTTQVWSIEITNNTEQLISISRLTLSVLTR